MPPCLSSSNLARMCLIGGILSGFCFQSTSSPHFQKKRIMERFVEWAKEHGGVLSGCEIKFDNETEQYRVIASQLIRAKSCVCSIPWRLTITPLTIVYHSSFGIYLSARFGKVVVKHDDREFELLTQDSTSSKTLPVTSEMLLVMFLAHERRVSDSFWRPYLAILPDEPTSPYLWENML
jgi:hypothetical protein